MLLNEIVLKKQSEPGAWVLTANVEIARICTLNNIISVVQALENSMIHE